MVTRLHLARFFCVAGAILTCSGVLTATPAFAHTPSVTPSCTGLDVSLTEYDAGGGANNRVTTTIDGVSTVADFGASYSDTFTWSQTASHTWSVVIDANRQVGDPTAYDVTFSGTWQACQEAPTTTTTTTEPTTTTTTVAPTTTTPATTTTLVLSEAPTTTPTTTTLVAAQVTTTTISAGVLPIAPTTTFNPGSGVLPTTGTDSSWTLTVAALAVAIGAGLVLLVRRRRPAAPHG